ncbi:MAG: DUF2769 domain-containing protein [Candidatus Heimdallarchaeota archaeon]|nr:DUF2769 domain-containing protein [Candidatus Heimdallarchaeota archaeon]
MSKKVDDNKENKEICKTICGMCPTYTNNQLHGEEEPQLLFCARGASNKKEIIDEGCICFSCPIFKEQGLEGGYFCMGKKSESE